MRSRNGAAEEEEDDDEEEDIEGEEMESSKLGVDLDDIDSDEVDEDLVDLYQDLGDEKEVLEIGKESKGFDEMRRIMIFFLILIKYFFLDHYLNRPYINLP